MRKNALLLRKKRSVINTYNTPIKSVISNSENTAFKEKKQVVNVNKYNPDVKSKYQEDLNIRNTIIKPSNKRLDDVDNDDTKVSDSDLEKKLQDRQKQETLLKPNGKPKRSWTRKVSKDIKQFDRQKKES